MNFDRAVKGAAIGLALGWAYVWIMTRHEVGTPDAAGLMKLAAAGAAIGLFL